MKSKIIFTILLLLLLFQHSNTTNIRLTKSTKLKGHPDMVFVPEGIFLMGSDEGEVNETPAHNVWVDDFWINKYPVTNAQYKEFINETKHDKPRYWNDKKYNHPRQPVVGVSWDDSVSYCRWLSGKNDKKYRLPTEAEWEKAARGTDGRLYPWGSQLPDPDIVSCELSEVIPEVGIYEKNVSPYGCYDMVGSVWQWCLDLYDRYYYKNSPENNPVNLETKQGKFRVVRGGNWIFLGCGGDSPEDSLRVTRRQAFNKSLLKKNIGFRYVLVK